MRAPKFSFFEIVEVISQAEEHREMRGLKGAVLGVSEPENDEGNHGYAILLEGGERTRFFMENALASTGQFGKREDYYPS
jgi:hypothetical protein